MAKGSIATAYVQVMPSMDGIKGQLEKGFGAEGTRGGKTFGSNLVSTAMKVIASAKIAKALWSVLNIGGELEQNLGGVQAVFGEFAASVTSTAEKAYNQMGLSASDYMATAQKMGSLFQGSGLTQQRALELTTQAMQRAADVASVMGIDTAMAMESIAGAAKGNFTMMDNLGVAMNAATLEAYALEKGINFEWNTASLAQKAELAMEMFFDRTAQYAGNFEREASETFSGAFESMKAAAKNVLGNLALGEDIQPSLDTLLQTAKTFLEGNFIPAVKNVIAGLPVIIGTLGGDVADAILGLFGTDLETVIAELEEIFAPLKDALSGLFSTVSETAKPLVDSFTEYVDSGQAMADVTETIRTVLEGIVSVLTTVVNWISQFITWLNSGSTGAEVFKAAVVGIAAAFAAFKVISTIISLITKAVAIFKGLSSVITVVKGVIAAVGGPIGIAVVAITALVAAVIYLWNNCEGFRNAIISIKDAIVSAWTAMVTNIQEAISNWKAKIDSFLLKCQQMKEGLAQYWEDIKAKTAALAASVGNFFTVTIPDAIASMIEWFVKLPEDIRTAFNNVISKVVDWAVDFKNKATDAAEGFFNNVLAGLEELPEKIYTIGENIVDGIWRGISDGWEWLKTSVKNLANSLFTAAKEALGIASPSKVFRKGVGRWIPAGIAAGIRDYASLVNSAIADVTSDAKSEFTASLRMDTTGSRGGKGQVPTAGKTINFVQNVYAKAQSAAELAHETRYQAEMKVLLGV